MQYNINSIINVYQQFLEGGSKPITGLTVTVQIRRKSDGYYLDFDDNTFKNIGWLTKSGTTMEDSDDKGIYSRDFNTTGLNVDIYYNEFSADYFGETIKISNEDYTINVADYKADTSLLNTIVNSNANKDLIIAEVDANEAKLDEIIADIAGITPLSVSEIWDYLLTNVLTVNSIGKLIKDNLDTTVSGRLATSAYTAPANGDITSIKSTVENTNTKISVHDDYKADLTPVAKEAQATINKEAIIAQTDIIKSNTETIIFRQIPKKMIINRDNGMVYYYDKSDILIESIDVSLSGNVITHIRSS